ncbi:hypothetical protein E5358_12765 [Palleniella muris]|uniref:Uncharacterized protein n=1 Tax=Palleniella muris TaxID=3038145 RepID=A0AC61QML5_9BACT|nr:hypothetical protein [Palleniella muris]TGX80522.1 hypothetical protein E5358_12765 [Palleniella muris]
MEINNKYLTDDEAKFCLLYVNAAAPYAGNARLCYQKVFPDAPDEIANFEAKRLMKKEAVSERIKELNAISFHMAEFIKPQTTETLLKIMHECAEGTYCDKDGNEQSPAALRAVSVHAAKELNSMYGIKEEIAHKVKIEGDGQTGMVFNLIMPETKENDLNIDNNG